MNQDLSDIERDVIRVLTADNRRPITDLEILRAFPMTRGEGVRLALARLRHVGEVEMLTEPIRYRLSRRKADRRREEFAEAMSA